MYTLQFPFRLPLSQAIEADNTELAIGTLTHRLSADGPNWYSISIDGFTSHEEAANHVNRIWCGLKWVLLHTELAPKASLDVRRVIYPKDFTNLYQHGVAPGCDGLVDGSEPYIHSTDKRIRASVVGDPLVTILTPQERVWELLKEFASFPTPAAVLKDGKLLVALDLYAAHFREASMNARFLTLVMCLEALAVGTRRPEPVLALLDSWRIDAEQLQAKLSEDEESVAALDSLCRELVFRKENSIRSQIKTLVLNTLEHEADAAQAAKVALKIYDDRSTLVHEGTLSRESLSRACRDAKFLVDRVLRARFLRRSFAGNLETPSST